MLKRHLILVLAGVALATNTAASASPRPDSAGSFLIDVVGDLAANRYGAAWDTLHPAQRAAIPRDHYIGCERLSPIPAGRTVVTVLGSRSVRIMVAGGARQPVRAFAFRIRIAFTGRDDTTSDTVVTTAHAVPVASGWAWILSPTRFAADRSSDCTT
jgi:hypothetical protein